MKLTKILNLLEADTQTLPVNDFLEKDMLYVATSDLMSDLLALIIAPAEQTILITGLAHGTSLRTAEMLDIQNIIYCRNKRLNEENTKMAEVMDINTFSTKLPMFDVIGLLYKEGLKTATRLPDET